MSNLSLEEIFKKLAEALGTEVSEIEVDYKKIVEEVKADERFVDTEASTVEQIARNRLIARKRRELSSPAISWEGIVLGVGDLIDTVGRQRSMTEEMFKLNPEKAIKGCAVGEGNRRRMILADEKGVALYPPTENNKKWKRAGKPLPEHSWLRNVFGISVPIDKKTKERGAPRPFNMTLNRQQAVNAKDIVLNKSVKFKGINKTSAEDTALGLYRINASTYTKFEVDETLKIPAIETIISNLNENKFRLLAELDEYHAKNENVIDRWVVTEGTVSVLNLEPNPTTQNLMMILDDESLLFAPKEGSRGVTCWIPTDRNIEIDFAQDSRVYVVGKTTRGKARDPVTGQSTDEPGDIMINVYGIYCPEMFKVKLEPVPLTEEALQPVSEEVPEDFKEEESWEEEPAEELLEKPDEGW